MAVTPTKTGPQTVLNERQLKVTLALAVVKLIPEKKEQEPAQPAQPAQ
jgi:hypothetical protein